MQVVRTYNKEMVIDDPYLSMGGSLIGLLFSLLTSSPSSPFFSLSVPMLCIVWAQNE